MVPLVRLLKRVYRPKGERPLAGKVENGKADDVDAEVEGVQVSCQCA